MQPLSMLIACCLGGAALAQSGADEAPSAAEKPAPAPPAAASPAPAAAPSPASPATPPPSVSGRPKAPTPEPGRPDQAPAESPEPPQRTERERGPPRSSSPSSSPGDDTSRVNGAARIFFTHLLAGDARSIVDHSALPFQLEDRRIATPEELLQEWLKVLRSKRTDLLTLFGIEVLSPAEMEQKYGKPPARLAALPWRAPRTYLAIGNLSGRAAVALFRDVGGAFRLVAYHD